MGMWSNLKLKSRLYLCFGVILMMLAVLTVIGTSRVNFINDTLTEITDVNSLKQRYAINYRGSVHDRAIAIRDIALATNNSDIDQQVELINQLRAFYDQSEQNMRNMPSEGIVFDDMENSILKRNDGIKATTIPLVDQVISLAKSDQTTAAQQLLRNDVSPLFSQWLGVINEFIDLQEEKNQTITPLARETAGSFQTTMFVVTGFAILISVVIASRLTCSIYRSLGGEPNSAVASVAQISQGDLTIDVSSEFDASLLASLSNMQSNLKKTVSGIKLSATSLVDQADQVSTSSQQISDVAERQSCLTSQTKDGLQEMQSKLMEINTLSNQTEDNSRKTTEFTDKGRTAIDSNNAEMERISVIVGDTVEQIQKLASKTKEIGSIVSVISSISEQTNLLALNAAIEAARAGESGRGFAVVADEVRQLAKRTGDATDQISTMISEVQKETDASVDAMQRAQPVVENGKALTQETSELLKEIETQALASLDSVKLVTTASQDTISSINAVASVMDDINEMSNDSITKVQENNKSTNELNKISNELNQMVDYFKVH